MREREREREREIEGTVHSGGKCSIDKSLLLSPAVFSVKICGGYIVSEHTGASERARERERF
jgi:hypothetical protein